jgi:MFS family permease
MPESGLGPASHRYVLYAIGVVFLISVFNTVDRTIVSLLAPAIQADLALSDTELGLLLGPSFSVVHFLFVLPVAVLADRTSRRGVIAVGLVVWSAMTALGGVARGFWELFATRMGVGIGEAAGSPPAVSLLTDTAPAAWRARALASLPVGALAGLGFGMLGGGWLAEQYGWRAALIVVGLAGIPVGLLVRFTLREPPRDAERAASPPLAAVRQLFSLPSYRWLVVAVSLAGVGTFGRTLWEPAFLGRVYGLSSALEIGRVYLLIAALPTALGAIAGSAWADRWGARDPRGPLRVCALGNLAATPPLIAFLLWPTDDVWAVSGLALPVGLGLATLGAFFAGFFSPPTSAVAQTLVRSDMRALSHAVWSMLFNLVGMGLGPLAVGMLSEHWGARLGSDALRWALVVVTASLPVSALAYEVAARRLARDLAR